MQIVWIPEEEDEERLWSGSIQLAPPDHQPSAWGTVYFIQLDWNNVTIVLFIIWCCRAADNR